MDVDRQIENAALRLNNINLWRLEVAKCNHNLEEWTKRLIAAENAIETEQQQYEECLAEIRKEVN